MANEATGMATTIKRPIETHLFSHSDEALLTMGPSWASRGRLFHMRGATTEKALPGAPTSFPQLNAAHEKDGGGGGSPSNTKGSNHLGRYRAKPSLCIAG